MRRLCIVILCFIQQLAFSQEKACSYYFDRLTVSEEQYHPTKFKGKVINLANSKDSTYSLSLRIGNSAKQATLVDKKNKQVYSFEVDFVFQNVQDIQKLKEGVYYKNWHEHKHKFYKNHVVDLESERDMVTGNLIIHSISYKNSRKRKLINEHYYFFGPNPKIHYDYNTSSKKFYLSRGIDIKEGDMLVKTLCLNDGKISQQSDILSIEPVDFTFNFTAKPFKPTITTSITQF